MDTNLDKIEELSNAITRMVRYGKIEYIDAITTYCERNNLEIDTIHELLSPNIKAKIEEEAIKYNLVKKTTNSLMFI